MKAPTVTVPNDLIGKNLTLVEQELKGLGILYHENDAGADPTQGSNIVTNTNPVSGSPLQKNGMVELYIVNYTHGVPPIVSPGVTPITTPTVGPKPTPTIGPKPTPTPGVTPTPTTPPPTPTIVEAIQLLTTAGSIASRPRRLPRMLRA